MSSHISRAARGAAIISALLTVSIATRAQTLTTLFNFAVESGSPPSGYLPYVLTLGADGNFYGTTQVGGAYDGGTVFKITPTGALTALYSFSGNTGEGYPNSELTLGADGNLYGMTNGATSSTKSSGTTIFKITPAGTLTTLYSFSGSTGGAYPGAALTLGPDGNFYGATEAGGTYNYGTIFKITPDGSLTTLHNFTGTDGEGSKATLTLGPDGNFYGTTSLGGFGTTNLAGADGFGTIFKVTPAGALATLYSFAGGAGGGFPSAALTLGPDGTFYGMANGIVVKVTPTGAVTKLYSFSEGDPSPGTALTLGPDGNFYGTIATGGAYKYGTIFKITPGGVLTTLYSFSGADGAGPAATLTLGSDGTFYGTTQSGGAYNGGTIFRFNESNIPSINANGIVNAATYNTPVAPGSIASVFGTFVIPTPTSSTSFPIPTAISGFSFQFGTAPLAPLFYGSQNQFNVQIPWELAGQAQTTVYASQNGQPGPPTTVRLATYAPGIFVMNSQTQQGAVLDANYHLVSSANPTTVGEVVQIYCTGLGLVTAQPATGAPAVANPLSWTTLTPIVTMGGATASVLFSGLVPDEVGLYQVNVQVPATAIKGPSVPLTISIGGVVSNTAFLAIQ